MPRRLSYAGVLILGVVASDRGRKYGYVKYASSGKDKAVDFFNLLILDNTGNLLELKSDGLFVGYEFSKRNFCSGEKIAPTEVEAFIY